MKTYTAEQIKETLRLHKLWLDGDPSGVRANLRDANMQNANLQGANMRFANMRNADMRDADMRGANLRFSNMQNADMRDADMRGANLQGANMRFANMQGADMQNANMQNAVGNMREIKSMQIDTWAVTYTSDMLQIGCQRHSIELWRKSDPRWIAAMDTKASAWWAKFGPIVLGLIDASPATATGKETR
jgi:hypothetical protein